MSKLAVGLWSIAGAGLGANVWLGVAPNADLAPTRVVVDEPAIECDVAAAEPPRPIDGCERQLFECSSLADGCETLVLDCRDQGEKYRGLEERFPEGRRDVAREARLEPLLHEGLDPHEDVEWSLECRAAICRVELRGDIEVALAAVQDAARPVMLAASFAAPDDPREQGKKLTAYFETHPPDRTPAMPILVDVERRFEESHVLDSCPARYGDAGTFNVRIDLDRDAGFIVQPGGSLVPTPTGACLLAQLRTVLDGIAIPPRHTGATRVLTYDIPANG